MASLREAKPLTERKSLSQRGRASYREEGPLTGRPASHREAGPFTGIWASHREDRDEALTKSILNIFQKAGLVKKKRSSPSIHKQPHLWASSWTTSESSRASVVQLPFNFRIQPVGRTALDDQPASHVIQPCGRTVLVLQPANLTIQPGGRTSLVQPTFKEWLEHEH